MKQLFYKFIDRGIDWIFRPAALGLRILTVGAAILVVTLGADLAVGAEYQSVDTKFSFNLNTASSGIEISIILSRWLGCLIAVIGLILIIRQVREEAKKERRQILLLVELRGLHTPPPSPSDNEILRDFLGERRPLIIDFRPQRDGELVDPLLIVERFAGLLPQISVASQGRAASDVKLAVGGLAAVPALFLAGVLLDDESNITVFDWKRDTKQWKVPSEADDGIRFNPLNTNTQPSSTNEVVLAVSCSYQISLPNVEAAFPGLPIAHLESQELLADKFWSAEKQSAFVRDFRDAIQRLANQGATLIHVILAAPSSLSIHMGMAYDRRLHPTLIVYQFERSATPAYPWGIRMPEHSSSIPSVVYRR